MSALAISLISFAFILGGTLFGFYLGHRLPAHHLSSESKDTVKAAWGMMATMSALVLGLLVASAKSSFDSVSSQNTQAAARIIMLDHVLVQYGPQAEGVRHELSRVVSAEVVVDKEGAESSLASPDAMEKENGMEDVETRLGALVPANDAQRGLLSQARQITNDLFLGRILIIEQAHNVLPKMLQAALIAWLTVLFAGLSLFAPRNKTVVATLLLCCLSISFAIYLINDMNRPLQGLVTVSSVPMREVLVYLSHH